MTIETWAKVRQDVPHKYRLQAPNPAFLNSYPATVTFTTPDEKTYPLPDPQYLKLHAAAAKVAHLSGAAEYIDDILRDMEETFVLSEDGASARVLEYALLSIGRQVLVH